MWPIVLPVVIGVAVLTIFLGLASLMRPGDITQRVEQYSGSRPLSVEERELQVPFSQRVIRPIIGKLFGAFSWLLPTKQVREMNRKIVLAGSPGNLTTPDLIGIKGFTMIILGGVFGLYVFALGGRMTLLMWLLGLIFVIIGFMLPDVWLSGKIRKRQLEITNTLPDALDMMTIAVEAGLSFEQSIAEIVTRWKNDLSKELRRVLYEIGLGKSRREALINFNERVGVPDVNTFVSAVNHSEELGTSLGRVLYVQSQELRIKRRQRAQEAANKVPIKMLFPMAFLIFPALFAVILGPAVPQIYRTFFG